MGSLVSCHSRYIRTAFCISVTVCKERCMKSLLGRVVFVAIVAFIALTPALTSQAQGSKRCFGLSDADCQLWQAGTDRSSMDKYSSYVMDYNITLKATGAGDNAIDFAVTGNGPL